MRASRYISGRCWSRAARRAPVGAGTALMGAVCSVRATFARPARLIMRD